MALTEQEIQQYLSQDAEQRFDHLVKRVVETGEIWILTDQYGSVMLNTDDEECVPIWPDAEFAGLWQTGEWAECEPMAISLKQWNFRWTPGLEEDGFAVVVFPLPSAGHDEEDGLVVWPEELDMMLTKEVKKSRSK